MSEIRYFKHKQQGQAMIFGLLFLAAVLMALLSLYNKGQLIKNRVQLENAADTGIDAYIITEDYIVGDQSTDTTSQNELFDELEDDDMDKTIH